MKRFFRRYLLSILLYGFITVIALALAVVFNSLADMERGYAAFGGENLIIPLIATLWFGWKYIIKPDIMRK